MTSFGSKGRVFPGSERQVSAAEAEKERSCSRVLNRLCRRLVANSLSSNAIVVSLWTLSGVQHSDAASVLCRNTQPFSWCHLASSQIHGFSEHTLARGSLAAKRFWAFCDFSFGHMPRSAREPDLFLGETSITSLTMTAIPAEL